jgi:hypothetical protein
MTRTVFGRLSNSIRRPRRQSDESDSAAALKDLASTDIVLYLQREAWSAVISDESRPTRDVYR